MQLTMHTDYALRLLIYLALHPDKPGTIEAAAASFGISAHHLAKVAQRLTQLGYVRSVRGRGGGLFINKAPEHINIGQVVRDTEPTLALVACFEPTSGCPIEPACALKGILKEAQAAFFDALEKHTLADLLGKRERLTTLLGGNRSSREFCG